MPVKPKSTPVTGSDGSPAETPSLTSVRLPSRDQWMRLRVNDDEIATVKRMAKVHGLTLTDFVRSRLGLSARYRKPPGTVIRVPKAPKPTPPAMDFTLTTLLEIEHVASPPIPEQPSPSPPPAPDPEPALSLAALMRR